ncbi:hypothetical protein FBZ98_10489 [Rhizobium sp. ERR 922]|nr:hypothetical protein FBZ99_11472 [Rhizobium sp. ERR1071]TWB53163.1 hypothetical protein FBZ98_10489 [Rhizobium sp. ERR 922]TWB95872.1 hypothetical protein FBZ97_104561 [Rhizobium sp. ERR 942]
MRLSADGADEEDVWYFDEVAVPVNGQKCWLRRAVDQDGFVLMSCSNVAGMPTRPNPGVLPRGKTGKGSSSTVLN